MRDRAKRSSCCADGRVLPIRDLEGTTPDVLRMRRARDRGRAPRSRMACRSAKPVLRVQLASGREFSATVVASAVSAATRLDDCCASLLATDAYRARSARSGSASGSVATTQAIVLLGHLVGDGSSLSHQPLRYTTASEANSEPSANAADRAFGRNASSAMTVAAPWHQLVCSCTAIDDIRNCVGRWLASLRSSISARTKAFRDRLPLANAPDRAAASPPLATDGSIASVRKACSAVRRASTSVPAVKDSRSTSLPCCCVLTSSHVCAQSFIAGSAACTPSMSLVPSISSYSSMRRCRRCDRLAAQARALAKRSSAVRLNPNVDTLPREVYADVRAAMRDRGISHAIDGCAARHRYVAARHFCFRAFAADDGKLCGASSTTRASRVGSRIRHCSGIASSKSGPTARRMSSTSPFRGPRLACGR